MPRHLSLCTQYKVGEQVKLWVNKVGPVRLKHLPPLPPLIPTCCPSASHACAVCPITARMSCETSMHALDSAASHSRFRRGLSYRAAGLMPQTSLCTRMISAPRSSPACVLASQYNNPQETYNYYYLPFCAPPGAEKAKHKWGGLGEVLEGNELIDSQLEVKFRSAPRQPLKAAWPCCALDTSGPAPI